MGSVLGIVAMVLGRCLVFGYLDPSGHGQSSLYWGDSILGYVTYVGLFKWIPIALPVYR